VTTAPGAAPTLGGVDEPAAWRELEAAVSDALSRYAQAVTGVRLDDAGEPLPLAGPPFASRRLHLARLSAARRARQILRAAEAEAAASAMEHGASYPMLADAAGMARQSAWKRYGPLSPVTARADEAAGCPEPD
jgi:hypothetical protein